MSAEDKTVSRIVRAGGLVLRLTVSGGALIGLDFVSAKGGHICGKAAGAVYEDCTAEDSAVLDKTEHQLYEYFKGSRKQFELPTAFFGTRFRCSVWDALCEIPYGEVKSYGEIAAAAGSPRAARAVGGACHANPISIIVPCHRVVGADGSLTGFGGGLEVKEKLLALERANK